MVRRINDAQRERLLRAMHDPQYRSQLARRLVAKEGLVRGQANYQRRYKSTMRRFQRYVTDAGEKRSFIRSPPVTQQQVRAIARELPIPRELPPIIPVRELPVEYYEAAESPFASGWRNVSRQDLMSIVAYHDANIEQAAQALGLNKRSARLLELATVEQRVEWEGLDGSGDLIDRARDFYKRLPAADVQDIEDFHDLLMNLPDWQIRMILDDLEDGETTFDEWLDAWRNDDMGLDAEDSEYWALWRTAYARATA